MPLFRRFGRPGLLDSVVRTAVVAGTATMTARAIRHGADNRARTETQAQAFAAARLHESGPAGPANPALAGESITTQLATLSSLKASGAISDAEFAKAKLRVLGA